jgi:mgtE-like transporter
MAFPRRARRLLAALRAEQRTLRQGFIALILGTATAFVAGIALGSITDTLKTLPGLIILIPAAIGMRGTIFGAMGARLGTSTHAGLFEVTRDRSGVLYQNLFVAVVSTFSSTLWLAALAKLSAAVFGLQSISFLEFVTIAVVGGIIDSAILLAVTVGLSVLSYRRGYDLDAVATPLITAAADMITIPVLFVAARLVVAIPETANVIVAIAMILVCLFATIRGALTDLPVARRVLIEMAAVVLLTPMLDILAGTVVEARLDRFVAFPALLVLVPPFVAVAGALGGILSSRLSSKLQLGVISPRGRPEGPAVLDAAITVVFGFVIFLALGGLALGYTAVSGTPSPGAGPLVLGTLVAGLLATLIAIPVSYYVAIVTTRFGLDPDNHSVPIITSVMDLSGVVCFLAVLSLFGVAANG